MFVVGSGSSQPKALQTARSSAACACYNQAGWALSRLVSVRFLNLASDAPGGSSRARRCSSCVPPHVTVREIDPLAAMQSMTYYLDDAELA